MNAAMSIKSGLTDKLVGLTYMPGLNASKRLKHLGLLLPSGLSCRGLWAGAEGLEAVFVPTLRQAFTQSP